jgi:tRNA A-37 threonylcarbamoyl transferase component Bud32
MYRKTFDKTPQRHVSREVKLQTLAAKLGLAPCIVRTDKRTYIEMEHVGPTLSERFGDDPDDLPIEVRQEVREILWTLWQHGVQYQDVTPYNFTYKDGHVWIIDFGHATQNKRLNWFLKDVFNEAWLSRWNPDFR